MVPHRCHGGERKKTARLICSLSLLFVPNFPPSMYSFIFSMYLFVPSDLPRRSIKVPLNGRPWSQLSIARTSYVDYFLISPFRLVCFVCHAFLLNRSSPIHFVQTLIHATWTVHFVHLFPMTQYFTPHAQGYS